MLKDKKNIALRLILGATTGLTLAVLVQLAGELNAAEVLYTSRRWQVVLAAGAAVAFLQFVLLAITFTRAQPQMKAWLAKMAGGSRRLGKWNLLILLGVAAAYAYLILGRWGGYFDEEPMRWSVYLLAVLAGCACLWASGVKNNAAEIFGAALLIIAVGYRIALYSHDLSTSLLSLNWSETSRYYYASLFFSKRIYGLAIPPSVLHPSRYLMLAVPFLFSGSPLWLHRLWQVILWVAVTALSSLLLARRISISDRLRKWMFVSWSFLFLLLGPVYYHLQIPLILLLLGFNRHRFWRSLVVVLLASVWAGISRINWFPAPGLLAAALYFLEQPLAHRPVWRYLTPPIVWTVLGTALAFGAQAGYALWSGNPIEQFTSSFSSDLLVYRLLPNPTYPAGVIPMAALVSAPLFILPALQMTGKWQRVHFIRWLGLAGILAVLLAGGLVVSTKIGGGSNLHNLDAYLALLLVIAGYLFFGRWVGESLDGNPVIAPEGILSAASTRGWGVRAWLMAGVLAAGLLMPVVLTITVGGGLKPVDRTAVDLAMGRLERFVAEAAKDGGEILFISERQLITFGTLQGVRMVPDYEKVFLMEMAMANDPVYLERFWKDLENRRFAMIITEPLFVRYKGAGESFGEENDAWVKNVAEKVMCDYEAYKMLREISLQLLTPRTKASKCQ